MSHIVEVKLSLWRDKLLEVHMFALCYPSKLDMAEVFTSKARSLLTLRWLEGGGLYDSF
jgi:hypothetical protein